jgi:dihydroorotate dehydrogenase electron transfer subunit
MELSTSTITALRPVARGCYELEAHWHAAAPIPGQFLTLRTGDATDPLLRRPFAFSGYLPAAGSARPIDLIRIIFERRGRATLTLSAMTPGDEIDLLGPLGRPFPPPSGDRIAILVAGGIGIGPILFLAGSLAADHTDFRCVIGARDAAGLPLEPIRPIRSNAVICTDDGSEGVAGTVIDGLETIPEEVLSRGEFYACGPKPMMAAVARFAALRDARCWVSMEQVMGCGVGACMGCAIRVVDPDGYERVCTEGPVFDASRIVW